MVLGITSLVLLCFYGLGVILAIVGLALAPGAKREIRESGGAVTGDGMVKAGIACSWVSVGLTILGIAIFLIALAAGAGSSGKIG
jgi:hypothetical protein